MQGPSEEHSSAVHTPSPPSSPIAAAASSATGPTQAIQDNQVLPSNAVTDLEDQNVVDQSGWKPWMVRQFKFFMDEALPDAQKAIWKSVILRWVELESVYNFKGTVSCFYFSWLYTASYCSHRKLSSLPEGARLLSVTGSRADGVIV